MLTGVLPVLEFAGLDFDRDTIIEAACLITDGELDTVVEVRLQKTNNLQLI
jgi:oligoribonuclease (3'-5' exoribonuclease)